MVKENIKASLNDRQIAITLVTAYMNFFGPLLPLGQNALDYYTSIKQNENFVLHRWRLLRHSLFFQEPNYF